MLFADVASSPSGAEAYLATRADDSPYLFPGRSAQTKGQQIYSRRRLFEKIKRVTAFREYSEKHPGTTAMKIWTELKRQGYPGGVKLTTRVLRDYFATQVLAHVTDPNIVRALMRHTNLNTTSRYMRTVPERLKEAVKNLGANPGGNSGGNSLRKTAQKRILMSPAAKRLIARSKRKNTGGRSRT